MHITENYLMSIMSSMFSSSYIKMHEYIKTYIYTLKNIFLYFAIH